MVKSNLWKTEEEKFLLAIQGVRIPDATLHDVDYIVLKDKEDFDKIPVGGGCYWIWTNEPVIHTLHKNQSPKEFDGGEIIYNGTAKDDVRGRITHHLLGHVDAGWSGISMDIYFGDTRSHRKKGLSDSGKVPYLKDKLVLKRGNNKFGTKKGDEIDIFRPIRSVEDLLKITLSEEESAFINENPSKIHFRNGINIFDDKHRNFDFRAYFIVGLSSLYLDFIEKKWRELYGLPKLCSYKSGR